MPQKLIQEQALAQTQTLLPQQLLVTKLLEMPLQALEQRIEDELADNAALEQSDMTDDNMTEAQEADTTEDDTLTDYDREEEKTPTETELDNYLDRDDAPDYLLRQADNERSGYELWAMAGSTLQEQLQAQMGEHSLTPQQRTLVEYLIGSLEDDGLLYKSLETLVDELAVYHNTPTTLHDMEQALSILQSFEPRGIAARSLQECLLLQVDTPTYHSPRKESEIRILKTMYDDFVNNRWSNLQKRLRITQAEATLIKHELTHLNPRPGNALSADLALGAPTITPDFTVTTDADGTHHVTLNHGQVPELIISPAFRATLLALGTQRGEMTREQKDTYLYTKKKVMAAELFINSIRQRQHTMLQVMRTIVMLQQDYFDEGDEMILRPMGLKDIAEATGLDLSTVSRVTAAKYVETAYGILPLKFFFSNVHKEGDNEVSTRLIKGLIKEMIAGENPQKPLTDEALKAALAQAGYEVARRTVAKYREQLQIPVARLRK